MVASIRLNLKLLSAAKRCVAGGQMLIVAARPQDGKARLSRVARPDSSGMARPDSKR
jgi:hypothetical protein